MQKIKLIFGLVLAIFLLSGSAFAVLDDAVIYWSMDNVDTTGATLTDLGSYGADATLANVDTGQTGILDQAYGYVAADANNRIYGSFTNVDYTEATIGSWFKGTGATVSQLIYAIRDSSGAQNFMVLNINSGQPVCGVKANGDGQSTATYAVDIRDGDYHRIVCSYVASTRAIKLYVDGVLRASTTLAGTGTDNLMSIDSAQQGFSPFYSGEYVDGYIDDSVVYDRALTDGSCTVGATCGGEIEDDWNGGAGINPYTAPTPKGFFSVTAENTDTAATLSNITVTLQNGTTYTNVTNSIVVTPFNDSSLQNFTVSVDNYFNQTFTNYNISVNLQANLTQYPEVGYYNIYNNQSLSGFIYTGVTGYNPISLSFTNYSEVYTITDGLAYIPLNSSSTVLFSDKQAVFYFGNYELFTQDPLYKPIEVTHDFTNSNDLNQSTYQVAVGLNATEIITGLDVSPANFTINGITKTDSETFYLNVGDYNVTFSKNGWFSKTQELNFNYIYSSGAIIGYLNNKTISSVSTNIFNVNVSNYYNSSEYLDTFQVYVSNDQYGYSETYNVTTGSVNLSTVSALLFNLTFVADGFHNRTYTNYNSSNNLTAEMFPTEQILMRFYSASSGELINQTVTVSAENSTTQKNFVFSNGEGVTSDLVQGLEYLFSINTTGFTVGSYVRTVPTPDATSPTMDFYLLVDGDNVTFTVYDTSSTLQDGVLIQIEKFVNGTYELTGSATTDVTGNAYLVQQLSDTHKITISKSGFVTQSFIVPSLQTTYTIVLNRVNELDLDRGYSDVIRDYFPKNTYWDVNSSIIPFQINIISAAGVLEYSGFKLVNISNNQILYEFNTTAKNGGVYTYDLNISQYNNSRVTLIYYFKIVDEERTSSLLTYVITTSTYYSGTLKELQDILDAELSESQKLFYWIASFLLCVIILAIFIRGVANLGLSLVLSLLFAWVIGVNLFIIGTISTILFIIILSQVRSSL